MPLVPSAADAAIENTATTMVVAAAAASGEQQKRRLRLPPGMRFLPTDEELITVYLRDMVAGRPLPGLHIPTLNLYTAGAEPWALQRVVGFPYGKGSEFYCFTRRSPRGPGALRTAGSGTWAAKGKDVPVRASRTGELVGHKLMLKFVPKNGGGGECANWLMHEFRLSDHGGRGSKGKAKQFQELVLCKIYQRGSSASSEESDEPPYATSFSA